MTIDIDGSWGEGGGQILRSSLALSLVTGKAFRMRNVRAGREKPGLLRQHLTALEAAAAVGGARVEGAAPGSTEVTFVPGTVRAGSYRFAIGTAGSTTLVLQTILPALIGASGRSEIVLEGGTHNPFAPPFDFLDRALFPVLRTMGIEVRATLDRPGFHPAGGGRIRVEIEPVREHQPIEILSRGKSGPLRATARVAHLARAIAQREIDELRRRLPIAEADALVETTTGSLGPGNVVVVEAPSEHLTEVVTGFGRKGATAETVAAEVAEAVRSYLATEAPVGPHLADQLLVPMAVGAGGIFRTVAPTSHTRTNLEIVRKFVPLESAVDDAGDGTWTIRLSPRA
jgi:RNA 3'-terminal phosphate cyclase (ATP)